MGMTEDRADLATPMTAFSLARIAQAMAARPGDDRHRLRLFFEFMRGADEAGPARRR